LLISHSRTNKTVIQRIKKLVKGFTDSGRDVVLNTSLQYIGGVKDLQQEKLAWAKAFASLQNRYFHAAAAGNQPGLPARQITPWNAAAIDGDLSNTAVVENRIASDTETDTPPFKPLGLFTGSTKWAGTSTGGNVSAFGASAFQLPADGGVVSYGNGTGSQLRLAGTSMATPQVAGLAAYLWALDPSLDATEILQAMTRQPHPTPTSGTSAIDAYAAVLGIDLASALMSGNADEAPVRIQIFDADGDLKFTDKDAALFVNAFALHNGATVFVPVGSTPNPDDRSRFDLNGDGKVGGTSTFNYDLNINYNYDQGKVPYELVPGRKVELDENAVTDLQVLCFYAYSKLFFGDISAFEAHLASKSMSCSGPLIGAQLQINDTNPSWSGLPATVNLTNVYPTTITSFQILGNSPTCGSGERGSPLFSGSVESNATFYGARVVTGMPQGSGRSSPPVAGNSRAGCGVDRLSSRRVARAELLVQFVA
jgi:Subtilase family